MLKERTAAVKAIMDAEGVLFGEAERLLFERDGKAAPPEAAKA